MTRNPRNAMVCNTRYLQNEFGDPPFFYVFNLMLSFSPCSGARKSLREGTFLIGGGGGGGDGPRLRRGGSLVNILQIGEGQTCFIRNRGRVAVFFARKINTPCRLVDSYLLTNTRSAQKPGAHHKEPPSPIYPRINLCAYLSIF